MSAPAAVQDGNRWCANCAIWVPLDDPTQWEYTDAGHRWIRHRPCNQAQRNAYSLARWREAQRGYAPSQIRERRIYRADLARKRALRAGRPA